MMRTFIVTMLVLLGPGRLLAAGEAPASQPAIAASQADDTVTLRPIGLSFKLPGAWLKWQQQFHNNVHLTATELAVTKNGGGEWDTEYAAVTNGTLPFDRCVAAAGGEGWGKDGVSFADIQMRVYVLSDDIKAVQTRIEKDAPEAVRTLFTPRKIRERNGHGEVAGPLPALPANADQAPADMQVPVTQEQANGWTRLAVSYRLHFGDYGGEAMVDLRVRQFGDNTVVAVFMYSPKVGRRIPAEKEIDGILASFDSAKK